MSSGMFEQGVKALMSADVDLLNNGVSALLVDSSLYTPDLTNHSSLADIPEGAILAELILTGKTLDVTVFRADDAVFPSVTVDGEETIGAVVIFKDADSVPSTVLICYLDNAPEFPITPDGTNVTVVWDTGANGVFKL